MTGNETKEPIYPSLLTMSVYTRASGAHLQVCAISGADRLLRKT